MIILGETEYGLYVNFLYCLCYFSVIVKVFWKKKGWLLKKPNTATTKEEWTHKNQAKCWLCEINVCAFK